MNRIQSAGVVADDREVRYGVFLRPDPATCWALSQITTALRLQFGLVSAAAFPPHATLVGNLAIDGTADDLRAALDPLFDRVTPIPIFNAGIERTRDGAFAGTFRCDIHRDQTTRGVNAELAALAAAVKQAVLPLSRPVDDHFVIPVADYVFEGHLSIVSHELAVDPRLVEEVDEFLRGLPIDVPVAFTAEWFSLFELRADWRGSWWENQSWRHLWSWRATAV